MPATEPAHGLRVDDRAAPGLNDPQSTTSAARAPGSSTPPLGDGLDKGLEVRGLGCERGGRIVFRQLSFDAFPGQLLQVRGSNGSGKSSLLRLLCGLLPPARGEVFWQGRHVTGRRGALATDLAYMGHASGMNGELSVMENLRFALRLAGPQAAATSPTRCRQVLDRLALGALAGAPARRLSQGQMRRLVLARVLLSQRRLWLLDEPGAGLDAQGDGLLGQCLVEHIQAGGIAIVTTHHDLSERVPGTRTLDMNRSTETLARAAVAALDSLDHPADAGPRVSCNRPDRS